MGAHSVPSRCAADEGCTTEYPTEAYMHPPGSAEGDGAWARRRAALRALSLLSATEEEEGGHATTFRIPRTPPEASALNEHSVPEMAIALLPAAAACGEAEALRLCCQLAVTALLYDQG
eukprot:gene36167-55537_t